MQPSSSRPFNSDGRAGWVMFRKHIEKEPNSSWSMLLYNVMFYSPSFLSQQVEALNAWLQITPKLSVHCPCWSLARSSLILSKPTLGDRGYSNQLLLLLIQWGAMLPSHATESINVSTVGIAWWTALLLYSSHFGLNCCSRVTSWRLAICINCCYSLCMYLIIHMHVCWNIIITMQNRRHVLPLSWHIHILSQLVMFLVAATVTLMICLQ